MLAHLLVRLFKISFSSSDFTATTTESRIRRTTRRSPAAVSAPLRRPLEVPWDGCQMPSSVWKIKDSVIKICSHANMYASMAKLKKFN